MKAPFLFGIRTKFVVIAAVIVATFSLIWGGNVIREEKSHLYNNLEQDGKLLMTALKAPIINTIILQEMGMLPPVLDSFVEEIVSSHELPTVYAYITDAEGKVLAHNDFAEYGKVYDDPLTRAALTEAGYKKRMLNAGDGRILDTAMPLRVAGKSWGVLRIGLSMTRVEETYMAFKMRVLLFSGLFFLVGTAIFYFVGQKMSRPLERLSQAMSNVELGAFEAKPLPARRDEIGLLQEAFHNMLVRLKRSELERQHALNCVIQHEKMATIGKIVAGVAHEVNNPLAAISACTYNIEAKLPPESRNCLEILKNGIQRIGTIVHQLSDFSRVGTVDLEYVASDAFFTEIEAFAAMALKKHEIRLLATDACLPPVVLHIDKGKMHQVVLNLILNATYASPTAGSIEFYASVKGSSYVLAVTDHGVGIPAEDLENVFDIFFTTKPPGIGSGIGLAVCRSIVDLHRGHLEVESRPGETTFTVAIPLQHGAEQ